MKFSIIVATSNENKLDIRRNSHVALKLQSADIEGLQSPYVYHLLFVVMVSRRYKDFFPSFLLVIRNSLRIYVTRDSLDPKPKNQELVRWDLQKTEKENQQEYVSSAWRQSFRARSYFNKGSMIEKWCLKNHLHRRTCEITSLRTVLFLSVYVTDNREFVTHIR